MFRKFFQNKVYRMGGSLLLTAILLCSMSFTCLAFSRGPWNLFYNLAESALFQALSTAVLFTGVYFSVQTVVNRVAKQHRHRVKPLALLVACGLAIPITAAWFGRPVDGFDFVLGLINGVMGNLIFSVLTEQQSPKQPAPVSQQHGQIRRVDDDEHHPPPLMHA